MGLKAPSWWYDASKAPPFGAVVLEGVAKVYATAVERRYRNATGYRAPVPVICIGNFTAGGTGKTPLALHVAHLLKSRNNQAAFLSRGYGGRLKGPVWVDPQSHLALDVGDEPLLLVEESPVVVARNRPAGAQFIAQTRERTDAIIMDDGMQNPSLKKDLVLAVVDGQRGLGNGRVIPAGPLRGDLEFQLGLADAVVVTEIDGTADGQEARPVMGTASIYDTLRRHFPGPVLQARYSPAEDVTWLIEGPVVAYAGIGNPDRFFTMLRRLGATLVETRVFSDHHAFDNADAEDLLRISKSARATLVTTAKDLARLAGTDGPLAKLRGASRAFRITLKFSESDEERLVSLLGGLFSGRANQG